MEENKKENVFKKVVNSKPLKVTVQVITTLMALADTAFIIYTCVDSNKAPTIEASQVTDDPPFQE